MSGPKAGLAAALADRYVVERELGAGGMATVYLAEDLKHDRRVAIKVLKPELAAVLGADRFVQEIKTTAALQHPHILPLFDSGTADGFLFYVMPYIQGETIREKLNRETQFGVDEAVRVAREVADALDYAHRHGVIHRDIKPENILLYDGRAMVMDFGIALAVSAAAGGRMTETGLSLGTPHYMSPEQATAEKEITARSDVYSIGSVLYEMLAGNPPHVGSSAQQVIMKIITETPEAVTKFRKSVPPNVAAAVAKSLEKLAADRFETAKAFAEALGNPGFTSAMIAGGTNSFADRRRRVSVPLLAAASIAAVALIGWLSAATRTAPPVKRTRFTIIAPDSARIRPDVPGQNFTISPDGSTLVFRGGDTPDQLYIRSLDDLVNRPIPGTDGAQQVKYSPDGKWLAFVHDRHLQKVPVSGGPAVTIVDTVTHFSWGDNNVIVFTRFQGEALWTVGSGGGKPELLLQPDTAKGEAFYWPHMLPGGNALLLDIVTHGDQSAGELAAIRLDDRKLIQLGVLGRNARYVGSGHILFGRLEGTVSAVPFDARSLKVTGPVVSMIDNVFIKSGGASEFGVATDGTLFYVQGTSNGQLLAVDSAGGSRPIIEEARAYGFPRYSPSGGRFVFEMPERQSFGRDIWVYNDLTKTTTRLTNDGFSTDPAWMGDGERIVWISRASGESRVIRQRWDGTGKRETLFVKERNIANVSPAPRGSLMAVTKIGAFHDLYLADDTSSSLRPLVVTRSGEAGARISPDGKWVAYYADESGRREICVIATSGDGGRHQISTDGGTEPVWAPGGKTLYYRAAGKMVAADIATTPAFTVTRRRALFADHFRSSGASATYDISPDGKTFLMTGNRHESGQSIVVVTGWFEELRERMGAAVRK